MNNNDILKKVRYIFAYNDATMLSIFKEADHNVNEEQLNQWLKKEEDKSFKSINDKDLAIFLNGFINKKRGKREGLQPKPEKKLTNNIILRKFKIALNLKDTDIIDLLALAEMRFSKHELSAFFRKPSHGHYRECKDQFLRNFLYGLELQERGKKILE